MRPSIRGFATGMKTSPHVACLESMGWARFLRGSHIGLAAPLGSLAKHACQRRTPLMQETPEPKNPGDEAPPDAPGVGESPCRVCHGTGMVEGQPCTICGGTGRVLQGIGGGR